MLEEDPRLHLPPPPVPLPFVPLGLERASPPGSPQRGLSLPDDMLRIILELVLKWALLLYPMYGTKAQLYAPARNMSRTSPDLSHAA